MAILSETKIGLYIWLILLSFILSSCARQREPELTSTPYAAYLDPAKRMQLEREALNGNSKAAMLVVDHYTFSNPNGDQVAKWLEVAMNDGSRVAKHDLADMLMGNSEFFEATPESCARGRALLISASNEGDSVAAEMLANFTPDCKLRH